MNAGREEVLGDREVESEEGKAWQVDQFGIAKQDLLGARAWRGCIRWP